MSAYDRILNCHGKVVADRFLEEVGIDFTDIDASNVCFILYMAFDWSYSKYGVSYWRNIAGDWMSFV